ncbi:MAG: PD-(D/E)XK nuclease family protein [Proteobacteria bacterium]|nr:PD-(D/E)XK nuclease family protein [Pseudomonadota bacterium]
MAGQKICYILQNPLECLYHARRLAFENTDKPCLVVLPRHIEPSLFESYLLEQRKVVSGVEIHKISSMPRNILSRLPEGKNLKKVDQIALSEHFAGEHTRGITRALLNSVLELRQSYFDINYISDLFSSKYIPEYKMLLDVFKKYEEFLHTNGLSDDADFKRIFVDLLSDPVRKPVISNNTTVIFAGFTQYSSSDLILIDAVSKNAGQVYLVNPDLFIEELDYSRVLDETLRSMGFELEILESINKCETRIFELKSPSEEAYHISHSIVNDNKASIYTSGNLDMYYSLFKYFMNDKVSARSSVRLDRSKMLSMIIAIMRSDIQKLINYPQLWDDYSDIRILLSFLKERALFPSDKKYFTELQKVDKVRRGAGQVSNLANIIDELIPLRTKPLGYVSAISELIKKINLREKLGVSDNFELSTVENLIYRVAGSLNADTDIFVEEFIRKLSAHAEENYLVRGLPSFTNITIAPSSLITSNTTPTVWFVGMNEESTRSNIQEDLMIKDSLILYLRAENFIKPTSHESRKLEDKIVCDSINGANITYVSNRGEPLECFKNMEKEFVNKTRPASCYGYFAETSNLQTVIKDYVPESVSSTSIETYIECPYRYFVSRVLKVDNLEADELTPHAMIQGQIAHTALERLLPHHLKGERMDVQSEIEKIINEYENTFRLTRSPINKVWGSRISLTIGNILGKEKEFFEKAPFVEVLRTEQKLKCYVNIKDDKMVFSLNPEGVVFNGKTDRIDVNKKDKSFYIIDYKKGLASKKTEIDDGRKVQLLLYMAAASLMLPEYKAGGGCYISLAKASYGDNSRSWRLIVGEVDDNICSSRSRDPRSCITINEDSFYDDIAQILSKRVIEALKGIKNGVFTIDPICDLDSDQVEGDSSSTERKICVKCDYKRCCGVKYWY